MVATVGWSIATALILLKRFEQNWLEARIRMSVDARGRPATMTIRTLVENFAEADGSSIA